MHIYAFACTFDIYFPVFTFAINNSTETIKIQPIPLVYILMFIGFIYMHCMACTMSFIDWYIYAWGTMLEVFLEAVGEDVDDGQLPA